MQEPIGGPPGHWDQRVPLGGLGSHAVRHWRWRRPRPSRSLLAILAGVGAAGAGLVLGSAEPQFEVGLDGAGYHVGGEVLAPRGGGAYQSAGGVALVVETRRGTTVAGASAGLEGRPMTGRCEVASARETCRFTLSGVLLTAEDERTSYGWHRRYSDGRTVAIRLTGGGDLPVPFALGR